MCLALGLGWGHFGGGRCGGPPRPLLLLYPPLTLLLLQLTHRGMVNGGACQPLSEGPDGAVAGGARQPLSEGPDGAVAGGARQPLSEGPDGAVAGGRSQTCITPHTQAGTGDAMPAISVQHLTHTSHTRPHRGELLQQDEALLPAVGQLLKGLVASSEERRVGKEGRSRWSPHH